MIEYVLILMMHVGIMGKTDSNSITSVPHFTSEAECRSAGAQAHEMANGTVKEIKFVCVKQTQPVAK